MQSEEKIIRALNDGSHEAFREIYDAHKFRILTIIRKLGISKPVAEELFQRVFVKLWDSRSNIDSDGTLTGYLNAIARNEVYSYWRKELKKKLLKTGLEEGVVFNQEFEDEDYRTYLFSLANKLPVKCRQIFDMRFLQQMSYKEIAHDLDISESTVENQIAKALKHIRSRMKNSADIIFLLTALDLFS